MQNARSFVPRIHFGAASVATIPISDLAASPTYVSGLFLFDTSSKGIIISDPVNGVFKNNTGRTITMAGTVTYQLNNGTGGPAEFKLWSERSVDGINFTPNESSLRSSEVPNTSEGSQTKSSAVSEWAHGESIRWAMFNATGGALSLQSPSETVNVSDVVTGFSFYFQLNEVG